MNKLLCLLLVVTAFPWEGVVSQCSVDTNIIISEIDTVSLTIDIEGALNDDLSSPTQGVCRVCINFEHEFLGDLSVELISPSGQTLRLLGPVGNFGLTQFSEWDVCFVPSSTAAMPDPGFADRWANNQLWGSFAGTYTGSYYPFFGNLEDLNLGPVNGTWTLKFVDRTIFYEGRILGFDLQFCDDTGLQCKPCVPNSIVIDTSRLIKCSGDSNLRFQIEYSVNGSPDSSEYEEIFYTIDSAGTILDQGLSVDLSTALPGIYSICGMSYFKTHNDQLPAIGSNWAQFQDSVQNGAKAICLKYSDCILIEIQSPPDTVFIDTLLCNADTFFVKDTFLIDDGIHIVVSESEGCDSITIVRIEHLLVDAILNNPDTLSCLNPDVVIDGSGSLYPPGTIVEWIDEQGGIIDSVPPDIVGVNRAGRYILKLTNGGCIDSAFVDVVTDSLVPSISIVGDTITCDHRLVSLEAFSNGQSPNFDWYFSNSRISTGNVLSSDSAGIYTVIVTDQNGCSNTAQFEVLADTIPSDFLLDADTINCQVDSATVLLSDSLNFTSILWLGPNGERYDGGQVQVAPAGKYLVETVSQNGCPRIDSIEVTQDLDTPDIYLMLDTIDCRTPLVDIVPSDFSDLQFEWYRSSSLISTDSVLTTDSVGVYMLIVTGQNGCSSTFQFNVLEEKEQFDLVLDADSLKCEGIGAKIWFEQNADIIDPIWIDPLNSRTNGDTAVISEPGWYVLTFSASSGCLYSDSLFVRDHRADFSVTITSDTISCDDSVSTINAYSSNGSLSYLWFDNADTVAFSSNWTTSRGGEYILKAVDTLGCTLMDTIWVTVDTLRPRISLRGVDTLNCLDTIVSLSLDSIGLPRSVEWRVLNGPVLSRSDSLRLTQPGDYFLEVISKNGCRNSLDFEIIQDTVKPLVRTIGDTITCDSQTAQLTAVGGNNGWEYVWVTINNDSLFGPSQTVANSGRYQLMVTSPDNKCSQSFEAIVSADTLKPLVALVDTFLPCHEDSLVLQVQNPNGHLDFQWNGPSNFYFQGLNPTIYESGIYYLTFSGLNGCEGLDSLLVKDGLLPEVNITGDTLTCQVDVVNLKGNFISDVDSFYWIGLHGQTSTDSTLRVDTTAEINLVAKGASGCVDTVSFFVPIDTTSPDFIINQHGQLICANQEVILSVDIDSAMGRQYDVLWTNSNDIPIDHDVQARISIEEEGWYYIQIQDVINGCVRSDSIFVVEMANDLRIDSLMITRPTCFGDSDGSIEILKVSGGSVPYYYQLDGMAADTSSNFDFLSPGNYLLKITDSLGCDVDTTLTIDPGLRFDIDIGPDTIISIGDSIILCPRINPTLTNVGWYQWSPTSFLDSLQDLCVVVFPYQRTTYQLVVESDLGCVATDEVIISVRDDFDVYIPNVVSTDQNGLNDAFMVFSGKGVKQLNSIKIYNRWGELVFHNSTSARLNTPLWNGFYNGERCPNDVYVYLAEILTSNDQIIHLTGDFTLIR